jgi:hypothetical protein
MAALHTLERLLDLPPSEEPGPAEPPSREELIELD